MKPVAVGYTRVSSRKQVDKGNSLENQKELITEFAKNNGWELERIFEERGESAKTDQRTELTKLREYIAENEGRIQYLIMYRLDRLARNGSDYARLREELKLRGVTIKYLFENYEDSTTGRYIEDIMARNAQFENELRADKCKDGMQNGVKHGRWMWPAPRGYINGRDREGKRNIVLDPDKEYVDTLKSAWKLVDNGVSCAEAMVTVNRKLKEIGRKESYTKQSFSDMLHNEIYVGVINSFGLRIESTTIPHLIDDDTFYRVQNRLSKKKNRGNRYEKYNPEYPLRGIIYCKNGHRMTASSPKGRTKHYPKYCCQKCKGEEAANYDVESTNKKYNEYVLTIGFDTSLREPLREAIKLNLKTTQEGNDKYARSLRKDLKKLEEERLAIIKKNINGIIPDSMAKELLVEYTEKEKELHGELSSLRTVDYDIDTILEEGMDALSDIGKTLTNIEEPEKRFRFQKWLFPEGLTYDGEKFGTTRIPLILRLKKNTLSGILTESSSLVVPTGLEPVTRGSSGRCSTN